MTRTILFILITASLSISMAMPVPASPEINGARTEFDPQALYDSIDVLRRECRFEDAFDVATELLATLESSETGRSQEVENLRRTVNTLEMILALPANERAEIAHAYGLKIKFDEAFENDEIEEAIRLVEEQLAIKRKYFGQAEKEIVETIAIAAFFYDYSGDAAKAEEYYREALSIDIKVLGENHPDVATVLTNLGILLHENGQLEEVAGMYRQAYAIFSTVYGEEDENTVWTLSSFASLLKDLGDLSASEVMFRRVIAVNRKLYGDINSEVAANMNGLATVLLTKGEVSSAEPFLRESLVIYTELGEEYDVDRALTMINLASLLQDVENYAESESFYREALGILEGKFGEDHELVAVCYNNIADLLHDMGDYRSAEELYRKALKIRTALSGDEHPETAVMLLNLARNIRDDIRYNESEKIYSYALSMLKKLLGDDHPHISMCLYSLSNLYAVQGRYEEADRILGEVLRIYELSRSRLFAGLSRATFQRSPYSNLANANLALGRQKKAWPATEMELARILAELLSVSGAEPMTEGEKAESDSLDREMGEIESRVAVLQESLRKNQDKAIAEQLDDERGRLAEARVSWMVLRQTLADKYPMSGESVFSLERIKKSMPDRSAIIGWLDVEEKKGEYASWVYVIKKKGEVKWARLDNTGEMGTISPFGKTERFRRMLSAVDGSVNSVKLEAREMWKSRMKPLYGELKGITDLIVIASGAMLGIPVEVLVDDSGNYLSEKFRISYAPSATLYSWLREGRVEKDSGRGPALLVGDPPFAGENASLELKALSSLPGSRSEIEAISSIIESSQVLLGEDAAEQNIVSMARDGRIGVFSILHFSTHALLDSERPVRSSLVLSQADLPDQLEAALGGRRIYDGLLSVGEIVNEFDLNADLVVLSACETGLGQKIGGEGYIGFAHALFQAGARSMILSLWKVDDEATSILMKRFYENYMGAFDDERDGRRGMPMSKVRALDEAKKYTRGLSAGGHSFEHPGFWSAFILIGDDGR